jgi:hypothetical protein
MLVVASVHPCTSKTSRAQRFCDAPQHGRRLVPRRCLDSNPYDGSPMVGTCCYYIRINAR